MGYAVWNVPGSFEFHQQDVSGFFRGMPDVAEVATAHFQPTTAAYRWCPSLGWELFSSSS